jgi:REP element-mobilizing transposase RayT
MDKYWLLTWTCYGTWLPGDDRGFVSPIAGPDEKYRLIRNSGDPVPGGIPALERYHESRLKSEPIYITGDHARVLLDQFRETTRIRNWLLLAVAIMANHTHVIVGVPGDPDPSDILGDFKSYGSRALNRKWGKPASGTWWTESGSKRKKGDETAVFSAIKYVRNQYDSLVVWVNDEAIRTTFGETGERFLASWGVSPC